MAGIEKDKWYSLSQLIIFGRQGYLPFCSRYKFDKLIREGKLSFVNKDAKKFLGKDVLDYFKRLKRRSKKELL